MSAPSDNPMPADVRDRAAAWHVRLGSDAADEADWLAFEAWLAQSPDHRRAYEAVEAIWSELDAAAGLAPTNVVALRPRATRRAALWLGPIAAALIAAFVFGLSFWPPTPPARSYQTGPGERRVEMLADGSRVTLNGASRITVTLGRRERRVDMAQAEAAFDVAKDPARPFIIQAGDREIRVVGTEFNVLRHSGQVHVTVRRGVVEVRPAGKPVAAPVARLQPGQSLRHQEGQSGDTVAAVDPAPAFAWTEGRLVFQGEPLSEAVATLNRYVQTPITVAPNAQGLPVRAVLVLGPEEQMLRSLTQFLPVESVRGTDSVRLSLRREAR